ncbi:MAG TPA: RICIN domain-containing protein [Solirubrobacteraceae bacterium]
MSVDPNGVWAIPSLEGNLVFDVEGGAASPGTHVIVWPRQDSPNQRWQFKLAQPGWWTLHSLLDPRLLLSIDLAAFPNGPIVVDYERADRKGQLWCLIPTRERGYWYLQSADQTNLVVAAPDDAPAKGVGLLTTQRSYDVIAPQAWGFSPSSA